MFTGSNVFTDHHFFAQHKPWLLCTVETGRGWCCCECKKHQMHFITVFLPKFTELLFSRYYAEYGVSIVVHIFIVSLKLSVGGWRRWKGDWYSLSRDVKGVLRYACTEKISVLFLMAVYQKKGDSKSSSMP